MSRISHYFAPENDVIEGVILRTDAGFTCMNKHEKKTVKLDKRENKLYIDCAVGKHFLEGQLDIQDGTLVYTGLFLT